MINILDEIEKEISLLLVEQELKISTIRDIYSFNPQLNEQYLIQVKQDCPFTNLPSISIVKAFVIDFLQIQSSKFKLCFCYVNNYGLDSYVPFEEVKIIKKLTKNQIRNLKG
jgi:hypothetical protein